MVRRGLSSFANPLLTALSSLVAIALLGATTAARAQAPAPTPLPLDLTWDVPAGCPDASTVERRVQQILQGPPPSDTRVVAIATIRSVGPERFQLSLSLRTADVEETRTIDAATCSALSEASAVVIALAIDPSRDTASPPPAAPPAAPPPPPALPAPPPARPRALRFLAFGLGGVLGSGTLPSVGAGVTASGALRLQRFRAGVLATLWFRQHPVFDATSGAGASFDMVELGAFGGYLVPIGRFAVGPALDLEATYLRVEGTGIRAPRASWSSWPTVVLGARGEARLTPWLGLFARADMVLAIDPPSFTLGSGGAGGGGQTLHEPAFVAARLTLGTEIVLP